MVRQKLRKIHKIIRQNSKKNDMISNNKNIEVVAFFKKKIIIHV